MSRLITEDAVYKYLVNKFDEFDISIFGNEFAGKILDGLGDIPTAYDVDKVVEELKRGLPIYTGKAIEIVRKGGVE